MHDAPDLVVQLPANFYIDTYRSFDRVGRLEYAKQNLPRETIISYQNEIAKSMSPIFGTKKPQFVSSFAGKYKQSSELTIEPSKITNKRSQANSKEKFISTIYWIKETISVLF